MKSFIMNIHDFPGCNLIFTMTTGKHVYDINVVQILIYFDIIVTIGIFSYILYISLGIWHNFGWRIFVIVKGWDVGQRYYTKTRDHDNTQGSR